MNQKAGDYMKLSSSLIAAALATIILQKEVYATPVNAGQVRKYVRAQVKQGKLLQKLPLASKAVKTKKKKQNSSASIFDTSGTPPKLVEIPGLSLKNLFWQEGVIDGLNSGTPPPDSCNQFYGSSVDGESAGYGSCYLAQNVGYSFQTVLQSAASFCYMQKMATAQSGVTVEGADSVNDAMKPASDNTTRIVKAMITGFPEEGGAQDQVIFFEIPGRATNKSEGNIYKHKLYFCSGGVANGKEEAVIKNNLKYTLFQINDDGDQGVFTSTVSSRITLDENNRIIFNPSTDKEVSMANIGGFCNYSKGEMTLKNGKIKQKNLDDCGGPEPRRSFNVMRYTGSSVQSLRFKEGGMKDNNFTSITEYRNSRYVSAPGNTEFNADLDAVNLVTDPFYNEAPSVDSSDIEAFDCNRSDQDATITMDFSNPDLQQHTSGCEDRSLDGMDFCREDDEVSSAEIETQSICAG
jgi:hypothetical protein